MFHWINGKNSWQYGFDFGLWTRQIVRERFAQRFGMRVSLAAIWCGAGSTKSDAAEAIAAGVPACSRCACALVV